MEKTELIALIVAIGGIIATIATLSEQGQKFFKWLISKIKHFFSVFSELKKHEVQLTEVSQRINEGFIRIEYALSEHRAMLERVSGELQVNGGTSLRDLMTSLWIENLAEIGTRRAMFTHNVAFWESDKDGLCVFASDKLAEYIDQNPSDILGNGWITTLHPDDAERVTRSWDFAVKQRRAFIETYRFIHSDGTVATVQGNCHPILNTKREIVKFIGVLTLKS
jgi:PAS domain S-box-containing protein